MISERISDDIPPQMKILNMVIPILIHFYSLVSNWSGAICIKPHKGVRYPTKYDVINDIKLFQTVYHRIYCRKFLTLSNWMSRYKSKCIRIIIYHAQLLYPHKFGKNALRQGINPSNTLNQSMVFIENYLPICSAILINL